MRELRYDRGRLELYPADIDTLQRGLVEMGYFASRYDIDCAWSDYSDSMAAGWMMVRGPEDASVLLSYLTEVR